MRSEVIYLDKPYKYTRETLEMKVNDYFEDCLAENRKPNKQGLAVYLGVESETLDTWASRDNRFSPAIRKAYNRMSDMFQQRTDSMAMLSIKQPCYGGFTDKPAVSADKMKIDVKISGGGADPFG